MASLAMRLARTACIAMCAGMPVASLVALGRGLDPATAPLMVAQQALLLFFAGGALFLDALLHLRQGRRRRRAAERIERTYGVGA